MAQWKRAFAWLTGRRGDSDKKEIKNYNTSMVRIATFYTRILYRMGHSAAEESESMVKREYHKDADFFRNQKVLDQGNFISKEFKKNIVIKN